MIQYFPEHLTFKEAGMVEKILERERGANVSFENQSKEEIEKIHEIMSILHPESEVWAGETYEREIETVSDENC